MYPGAWPEAGGEGRSKGGEMTFTSEIRGTEKRLLKFYGARLTPRQLRRLSARHVAFARLPAGDGDQVSDEMRTRREESEYSHSEGAHRD